MPPPSYPLFPALDPTWGDHLKLRIRAVEAVVDNDGSGTSYQLMIADQIDKQKDDLSISHLTAHTKM